MDVYRSLGYRLWVIGGLAVIVAVGVGLGLSDPTNQNVIFAILPLLAIYMGGIFLMQGRSARRMTRAEEPAPPVDRAAARDEPPTRRADLAAVLAVEPIDAGQRRTARSATAGILYSQVTSGAVLTALILVGVGLFYAGVDKTLYPLGDSGPGLPVVFLPILAMIVFLVLRIPFVMARGVAASNAELEPLGLALTETPTVGVRPRWGGSGVQTDVRGPSVITGRRHGNAVRIEMDSKSFRTRVGNRSPAFKVASKDGKLSATGDAPAAVREVLAALGAASRWRGVKAEGGADGILVTRRSSATASTEQRWMDDLWLAERLAEADPG